MPPGPRASKPLLRAWAAVNPPWPRVWPPGSLPGGLARPVLQVVDFVGICRGIAVALTVASDDNGRVIIAAACNGEGLVMTKTGWTLITATGVCVGLLSGV